MNDTTGKDREEILEKTGMKRPEDSLPPDPRKSDRREKDLGPPGGFERRKGDRRKTRSNIGRERYLDMVMRERALLAQQGQTRSAEQLLSAAGAGSEAEVADGERDSASGDQLRQVLPVQSWLPLSIHLVSLDKGVLTIAPLYDLTDRQLAALKNTALRIGLKVEKIDIELWDRSELVRTLQSVHDLSADRCEKTLAMWLNDIDNGLLLNQFQRDMLAESLQMRVSDIHLVQDNAPDAPNWIKYRIDGDMVPMHLLPADAMARLTTLLKRDAGLNFGDRSTPKDGRFGFTWQGRAIDVRVAAGPQAQDGEKLTLRLLDRASLRSFEELFSRYPMVNEHLTRLLAPEIKGGGGLLLMSGPTGSGKSTTLYACVLEIDRRRRHVLSIEDPIEYEMRYATQWQVADGPGRHFSDLIRAAMRHDPDYIIIGEMRDAATVETSLKAAESGHTVISTIHADTAVQTLERLKSFMPSERERSSTYTLSQQIRGVLNQRLIKTLCHSCTSKIPAGDALNEEDREALQLHAEHIVHTHNPNGCDLCNHTGVLGRALLLEALVVDTPLSQRDPIFHALMHNVNDILHEKGVTHISRADGVRLLVADGQIDPKVGLVLLRE
ncbi:MAG: ATPase, T2SS/T4P/T4SS family [Alphaproteobacteria bacterium]|nr:ATPase, T2SS/T4P/T4SS family [Alphaproteobacteria bacterium]